MSDTPNNDSGDDSQGEQPQGGQSQGGQPTGGQSQGGQPAGGQGGQSQGRQAPQGQAAGGQAPQGQPAGGTQPQGQAPQGQAQRAPVNTGPSVGDIFSRNDTLDQIKLGVVMYALVGFGVGLAMFGLGSSLSNQSSQLGSAFGAGMATIGSIGVPIAVSALLAVSIGESVNEELSDVADNLVFATAGVTTFVGSLVTFLLSWIMLGLGTGNISFNGLILPLILTGLGAAIIAVGRIWAEENLLGPAAPPQGRQQY